MTLLTPSRSRPKSQQSSDPRSSNPNLPSAPLITGSEHASTEFIESFMDVREQRFKYPSLQGRNLLYAHLDDALVNQIIEVLEKSGWNQSDFTRLVFQNWFTSNRTGLFALFTNIHDRKLLESDNIEDLKFIRDNLKPVVANILASTGKTISSFRKSNKT